MLAGVGVGYIFPWGMDAAQQRPTWPRKHTHCCSILQLNPGRPRLRTVLSLCKGQTTAGRSAVPSLVLRAPDSRRLHDRLVTHLCLLVDTSFQLAPSHERSSGHIAVWPRESGPCSRSSFLGTVGRLSQLILCPRGARCRRV